MSRIFNFRDNDTTRIHTTKTSTEMTSNISILIYHYISAVCDSHSLSIVNDIKIKEFEYQPAANL